MFIESPSPQSLSVLPQNNHGQFPFPKEYLLNVIRRLVVAGGMAAARDTKYTITLKLKVANLSPVVYIGNMDNLWSDKAIAQARKNKQLQQTDAASFLAVTPEYLSMLENGKGQPSQKLISKMAALYDQPITFFLKVNKSKVSA